uniref:Uncharacterized protein n=1 Tax=Meloidogyne enterolobii TaxID=390850 RepID=A0A6V7V660_MELEN|nr:unnamed protein product [Meloidogyne enterolobii]
MNLSNVVEHHTFYRVYAQRWIVLTAVCLLALSNATQWIAFAPLHNAVQDFYCINFINNNSRGELEENGSSGCDVETWISQIFQIVGVLTGLFGMYITDRYGIRVSCHLGAALNLCGAIIRFISSLPLLEKSARLPFLYFGQIIAAMSQPFFLCLSPKVAEYWFGEDQRALANSLSFIANPFGVFLGSIAPLTFSFLFGQKSSSSNPQQTELLILYVNLLLMILSAFTMIFCLLVTRQKPPTPPSASSDCDKPEFSNGLFLLFNSRTFLIQTLTFGMAFALQWSIFFTASKQLVVLGFDNNKISSGDLLAFSAFAGTLSTIFGGWIVDRTKKFNEFIKCSYIGIAITATSLNFLLRNPLIFDRIFVLIALFIFFTILGIFTIPVFPISLELGVESTFPVAEASSSGILVIAGQLQLFLLTFTMHSLESVEWIYGDKRNYKLAIDFWTLSAVLGAIFAFLLLRPRYNRLEYERNVKIQIN